MAQEYSDTTYNLLFPRTTNSAKTIDAWCHISTTTGTSVTVVAAAEASNYTV